MAGKINGKWGSEIVLGKWEQADERPDMAMFKKTKSGKLKFQFKLDKGNGQNYLRTDCMPIMNFFIADIQNIFQIQKKRELPLN